MGFILNLLPQDGRYFDLMSQTSELASKSVHLLHELMIEDDPEKVFKCAREIEAHKIKAKEITSEITEMLCRTLVTPFDHEDIYTLSRGMYKILKLCEKTEERFVAFEVKAHLNDFYKLSSNMVEASDVVHSMIVHLNNMKDSKAIHVKCALIHNIESNTDRLLNQLTIELYKNEDDFKQILIHKELYALLESIVDKHRDLANIILEIVLKHS